MIRKIVTVLVLLPVALAIVLFAVGNRAPVAIALDPFGGEPPLFTLSVPLFLLTLIVLILAPKVPLWQLASWGALVAAVGAMVAFRRLSARNRTAVTASLRDVRETVLDGIAHDPKRRAFSRHATRLLG